MSDDPKVSLGAALGRIPSGLVVLIARQREHHQSMLASWVQQAGFDPPMVSVAVKEGRPILDALKAGSPAILNLLADDNQDLLKTFAKGDVRSMDGIAHEESPLRLPILKRAVAWCEGRATSSVSLGDHVIVLIKLTAGAVLRKDAEPRVHLRKSGFSY